MLRGTLTATAGNTARASISARRKGMVARPTRLEHTDSVFQSTHHKKEGAYEKPNRTGNLSGPERVGLPPLGQLRTPAKALSPR
jgi:hypothetical protein